LGKGSPVIVVGHVYTSEYEDKEGVRRSSVEMRATSVGPDLARCIVRIIEKTGQINGNADAAESPAVDSAEETAASGDGETTRDGAGLKLSA
jgi:single-strand DNA-binding protein